jgi:hypothetical protein
MSEDVMTAGSLPSFRVLRELAAQPVAKRCISYRSQQIRASGWDIKLAAAESAGRAREMRQWLRNPDRLRPLPDWLETAVTDVLGTDSLTVLARRTIGGQSGWLGSGMIWLHLLDGTTVKPAVDAHGRMQGFVQPWPPGDVPRPGTAAPETVRGADFYALPDALYLPRNPRGWSPYGCSPVESAIVWRDGEIDPVATDAAMPGAFGIEFDEDGEVSADRAPFFADGLRAWLKAALFDRVLHDLCKAPDLEWEWTP